MTIAEEKQWFTGKMETTVTTKTGQNLSKHDRFMMSHELVPMILPGRPFMNFGVYLTIIQLDLGSGEQLTRYLTDSRYEFAMDPKRLTIEFPGMVTLEHNPTELINAVIADQPIPKITINFKDRSTFEAFSEIIKHYIANEHFQPDYHFYRKLVPKCECGVRKAIGGEYACRLNNWPDKVKSEGDRIQPWHLEFICFDCMVLYLKMEGHLKLNPPWNPLETFQMEMASSGMLKLARRMGDQLSLAHANVMEGMVHQGTEKAIAALTEALPLLRKHESFKPFGFYSSVIWSYKKAISLLAKSLFTTEKYDEALVIYRERLEACNRFGTPLEASFTQVEIGQTHARLGKSDAAEQEIAAGLEGLRRAGASPSDVLYIHAYLVYVDLFLMKKDMTKVTALLEELRRKGGSAVENSPDYQNYMMALTFRKPFL